MRRAGGRSGRAWPRRRSAGWRRWGAGWAPGQGSVPWRARSPRRARALRATSRVPAQAPPNTTSAAGKHSGYACTADALQAPEQSAGILAEARMRRALSSAVTLHCAISMRRDCRRALGGSSNGRTSGFGPENRGSNPCPPAVRLRPRNVVRRHARRRRALPSYSLRDERPHRPDPRRRPGHAHALEHAEGAARAVRPADGAVAGAGGARGRRGAGRRGRLAGARSASRCCPRASSWRCSRARTAPAARSSRRWQARRRLRRPRGGGAGGGAQRRRAARQRGGDRGAARGARARRRGATMATTVLDDPSGYGRVVRDASGAVERVVETKKRGRRQRGGARDRARSTRASTCSTAAALLEALPRLSAENAQGELYLPQVLDLLRADGATVAAHVVADERLVLGVNDRVALAHVRAARAASDPRAAHARGRDDRRPGERR